MDPLTHTATGLFLSRIGLNRWTPRATPILLLAANAPDLDILTASGGSLNYLHYHRHLTHSLLAMPLMAILPVLLVRWAGRKPVRWLGAFLAALVAVASHLLLDLTNAYGIRLLLPFSGEWLRLDLTGVIDLWIWGALLLGMAAPFVARLVGSEISSGTARPRHYGRGFAGFALFFVLLYNCGRGVLHSRALAVLDSRLYRQSAPLRVAALPHAANPLLWRGIVETSDFYAVEDVDLAGEFDPARAEIFRKPGSNPAIDAASRTETFRRFLEFSQYPLWRVSPAPDPENGRSVELLDMRFGTPLDPGFMASAVVDSQLRVRSASFSFGTARPR
jgi:inner membrane protein